MAVKDYIQQPPAVSSLNPVPAVLRAVPVKLAEFWQEEPALWFTQAEAQFLHGHVLDGRLQANYLIASLWPSTLKYFRDILTDTTADKTTLYNQLKDRLVHRFAATKWVQLSRFWDTLVSEIFAPPSSLTR